MHRDITTSLPDIRPTHCVVLSAILSQQVVARVLDVLRRHQAPLLHMLADVRDDRWEIELFIRLPANRHDHLFARLEAIVDVLAVEVWSFSS